MAKFIVCAVYDAAIAAFSMPFFAKSVNEARRGFGDAVADPKMEFGKHPQDYSLHTFGEYDDSGEFTILREPTRIALAVDYCIPAS